MLANFTVHGCACSGVSNPYGFGAYCARWETPTQNPWCYVLADCPTGGAAGDYGKFEDCAEAPTPWSEAAADAAEATVDAAALQPLAAAAATSFAASAADASAAAAASSAPPPSQGRESAALLRVLQTALSQQRDTVGRLRRVHELIEREHDAVAEARLAMRPPTAAWPPPAFASPWAPRRPVWPMWGGAAAPASWAAGGAAADTVDVDAAEPLGDVAEDLERETSGVRGAVRTSEELGAALRDLDAGGKGARLLSQLHTAATEAGRLTGARDHAITQMAALAHARRLAPAPAPRAAAVPAAAWWGAMAATPAAPSSSAVAKAVGALHSLRATHERMVGAELDHLQRVQSLQRRLGAIADGVPDEEEAGGGVYG